MSFIDYFTWFTTHLGALGLILLAAAGLGHVFLRKYQFDSWVERLVFTLALGLGLSALLIFTLGLVGLLYQQVIFALTLVGALGTVACLIRPYNFRRLLISLRWRECYSARGLAVCFLVIIGVSYWSLLLLSTQYPPVHWDAISYHLVLCREYLLAHRIVAVMGVTWPVLPALNHMLFTWGMALQDDIVAQMIEHVFLMLTAMGLYAWGKRGNRPLFGLAAAAFWLSHPLLLWLGEAAYVEVCLAGYVFLGIYALRLFWEHRKPGWWYLAMAMLGMASGVKISGPFFIIIGSGLGIWALAQPHVKHKLFARRTGKDKLELPEPAQPQFTWRSLAQGWIVSLIILLPWYIFFTYHTGSPIWPTFPQLSHGVWGAPAVVENMNTWYKTAAEPRTLANFLMLPVDWIRYPSRFYAENGLSLNPLIVAWPLAWILALWNRSVRWWALWALGFTFYWFLFAHQLRYWLPALPLAGLALFESIRWATEKISRSTILHTVVWMALALSAISLGGGKVIEEIRLNGWPPTDEQMRKAFLTRLNGYNGVRYVNKQANQDDIVCVINGSWLNYYFKNDVLDLFAPLQSGRLPNFRWPDDEQWMRWLESQNITWIFVIHADAPNYVKIPKQNLVLNPIWPDYELVYADAAAWAFRRKPVPPDI